MSAIEPKDDRPVYSDLASDDQMIELVQMFVSENPDRVNSLRVALNAGDFETLKRLSHQLKGAAGGYGFHDITAPSRALEISAGMSSADPDLVRQDAENLISFLTRMTADPDPNQK